MKKNYNSFNMCFIMSSLCFAGERELKVSIMGKQFEDISGVFCNKKLAE